MNERLSSGWLVGLRRPADFSAQEVALPTPTEACEQRRGHSGPSPLRPAFLDKVVQVKRKHVQPQRHAGREVIPADRKSCAGGAVDRPVRACETKGRGFSKPLSYLLPATSSSSFLVSPRASPTLNKGKHNCKKPKSPCHPAGNMALGLENGFSLPIGHQGCQLRGSGLL